MSYQRFKVGDRVNTGRGCGTIVSQERFGYINVDVDKESINFRVSELAARAPELRSLTDEVQDLINILVATGNDNKRLLSRKVASLLHETKGALTRGDKMQAAAMLLVSAGLAADHVPERDDG